MTENIVSLATAEVDEKVCWAECGILKSISSIHECGREASFSIYRLTESL